MKTEREVWFQPATTGGWLPIHPKTYALLFRTPGIFSGGAFGLIISFQGPSVGAVVSIFAAIFIGVAT
jgi:hypothetical protein